jgi:hypothetical protein
MFGAPQQQELHPVDEIRLISRILLLVIYLFLGSLLSLTAVSSVFANENLDIGYTTYGQESDSRTGFIGKVR